MQAHVWDQLGALDRHDECFEGKGSSLISEFFTSKGENEAALATLVALTVARAGVKAGICGGGSCY